MRFALGMDNQEIARALGRTDGATKVLIHRAIKQLEQMIAEPTGSAERMSAQSDDLEALLGKALAPVEPPEHLRARLEETLHDDHETWRPTSSTPGS